MELTERHFEMGQIAYEGYIKQSGGVSLATGDKLPPFAELKQPIKDAWAASAIAVSLSASMRIRSRKVSLIDAIASAMLNARGNRRGVPQIVNVLEMVPAHIRADAVDDADAILTAILKEAEL
ncbi:MAG: hypothetical protein ABI995_14765 [Acidobacteriota bacterium]